MVKTQGLSEYDRLDALVQGLVQKHGLRLDVSGWTRKTYDVFAATNEKRMPRTDWLARIESYATTSGEVRVFDDRAQAFAEELASALEKEFGIEEATVLRVPRPEQGR